MWCFHRKLTRLSSCYSFLDFDFFKKKRDERAVVLWSYSLENIIPISKEFEEKLIKFLWRTRSISHRPGSASSASTFSNIHHPHYQQPHHQAPSSVISRDEGSQAELNEKTDVQVPTEAATTTTAAAAPQRRWWSWRLQPRPTTTNAGGDSSTSSDPEKGGKRSERKLVMIGPIYAGCGAAMSACGCSPIFFFSSSIFFPSNSFLEHHSRRSTTNLSYFFSLLRFHDVCCGCSSRRIRSGWELCSICVVGHYTCHFLRLNCKSTLTYCYCLEFI